MIHLTIVEFACQALLGEMLLKYWAAITCRYSQNRNLKNHHLLFHRQKPGIISRPPTISQSYIYDNPVNFGLLSPFTLSTTNPNASTIATSLGFSSAMDPIFPREFLSQSFLKTTHVIWVIWIPYCLRLFLVHFLIFSWTGDLIFLKGLVP